ncbi:MAG: ribonuclease PH [Candidatus Cloacimonetes bacterium]|nr:ribonuclease PH [Candidatus Cloacimonadota bacterium]
MKKRETRIERGYLKNYARSVMIETGNTKVLCAITVQEGVPGFLRDKAQGWLTAEYAMLPCSSNERFRREVNNGKITGRTAEIQRLIGRSLRAVVDLEKMAGYTVLVDCDVIQADGGTRTASITGASIALYDTFTGMIAEGKILENPLSEMVAAISVGLVDGEYKLDLDYESDSRAEVDLNVVMTESGKLVDIQGTAEGALFDREQLNKMIDLAEQGIRELIAEQKEALKK